MAEVGSAIARIPEAYAGRSDCQVETPSVSIDGRVQTVKKPETDGEPTVVEVRGDGETYELIARPYADPDGMEDWRAAPLKTASGIDLGEISELRIEPPDIEESELEGEGDEFEVIANHQTDLSKEGGRHAGGRATKSLADRRSARDHRMNRYSGKAPASDIRDRLRATGTAAAVVREFRRLVAEEIRTTDSVGYRPDIRNYIRMRAGDETAIQHLWERQEKADPGDRVLGIALDMSGSLGSSEDDAKAAVGALALAAKSVDDEVISVAFPEGSRESALLTGPYESWRWQHLNATSTGGGTPMFPALKDLTRLMRPVTGRDEIIFVITDGRPSQADLVKNLVETLRDHGTAVVGFGFGRVAEDVLASVFGESGYRHVDVENLPRALISAYLDQLETDAQLSSV